MSGILPRLKEVHEDVLVWTNDVLSARGIPPVSELTMVREMAWSMVARVDHTQGTWYFKLLPDYFHHELPVSAFLHRVEPKHCGEVIATEPSKGWLLVNDAGPMFRDRFEHKLDPQLWYEALHRYAQLQIALMGNEHLQSLGLPNRSIARIPELVEPAIDYYLTLEAETKEEQFLPEHRIVLTQAFANWEQWVAPLYRFGISDTIHHGDMHDGNLAYHTHAVIFDWGDCSISHPFTSLRSAISSITRRFELSENSPELEPFYQAYLEPWQQFAPYQDLRDMIDSAQKVWSLVSFLSWGHAIQNKADSRATRYEFALPALLREFVEAQAAPSDGVLCS